MSWVRIPSLTPLKVQVRKPAPDDGRAFCVPGPAAAVRDHGSFTAARRGATTAQRGSGVVGSDTVDRFVTIRLVSARPDVWQAPRVLGRPDLNGLLRNDCGRQRRSPNVDANKFGDVGGVRRNDPHGRNERMTRNDLILHRLSTPDSCGVTIAGSALHGRDLGIRLWFMAPSRPVCPRKVAQRRGSWSAPARSACTGLGRPGCSPAAARTRPNPFSSRLPTAMKRTLGRSVRRVAAGQLESTRGR